MTARLCKNCAHVRLKMFNGAQMQTCGIARLPRIVTYLAREKDAPCGPDGDKFAPKQVGA